MTNQITGILPFWKISSFPLQFVPFREFLGGKYSGNANISQAALAKEVLAEIPDQIIQYMKANNIKPKPPRPEVAVPGSGPPAGQVPPTGPGMAPPQGQAPPQMGGPAPSWAQNAPHGTAPLGTRGKCPTLSTGRAPGAGEFPLSTVKPVLG